MLQRQTWGKGGSPGSNVQGSVHDHNHLDVQPVPLRGVPSWLVAHKHRILFCICEKRTWGKRGKRKSSQELTGPGRRGEGVATEQNHIEVQPCHHFPPRSVILGNVVIEKCSLRIIELQFHFLMLISLGLDF